MGAWLKILAASGLVAIVSCASSSGVRPTVPTPRTTSEWSSYGANPGGLRFAPLTQITPENVALLKQAWIYNTGDVSDGKGAIPSTSAFEATPILVNGRLIFCTPFNRVISLDPLTGQEVWVFDPKIDLTGRYENQLVCRGVSAWTDRQRAEEGPCRTRVFTGTNDARLFAIDANGGERCRDFGTNGENRPESGCRKAVVEGRIPGHIAPCRRSRPGGRRLGRCGQSTSGRTERGGSRLRCPQRGASLGMGSRSTRFRLRGRARERRGIRPRYSERLGRHVRRRGARARLRSTGQSRPGFFQGRTSEHGFLRKLRGRARGGHRKSGLAFPDRSPRSLGLRRACSAGALHAAAGGERHSRARAGDQDGPPLHPESCDGRAALSCRGAPGPTGSRSRRNALPDTACPGTASSSGRAVPEGGGRLWNHTSWKSQMPGAHREHAKRWDLHPSLRRGERNGPAPGKRRGTQLERRRHRSRAADSDRECHQPRLVRTSLPLRQVRGGAEAGPGRRGKAAEGDSVRNVAVVLSLTAPLRGPMQSSALGNSRTPSTSAPET